VLLAAVADGMGGHSAGEIASRTAIDIFSRTVVSMLVGGKAGDFDLVSATDRGFEGGNAEVFRQGQAEPEKRGMGTTLTTALIYGHRVCIGHVGDSRAYLIRRGEAKQLTTDHAEGNLLTRALGTRTSVKPDVICEDLQDGDVIVLSTDGLHNSMSGWEIAKAVSKSRDAQAACEGLVAMAEARDGSDNITAACLGIGPGSFRGKWWGPSVIRASSSRRYLGALLGIVLLLIAGVSYQILKHIRPPVVAPETPKPARPAIETHVQTPSAVASQRLASLMLVLSGEKATVQWRAGERLSVTVAGRAVSSAAETHMSVSLPRRYLPAPYQRVALDLFVRSPTTLEWELGRFPRVLPDAAHRHLWIDGKRVRARTGQRLSESPRRNTSNGVVSSGTAPRPKTSLTFYVAGKEPIPVVIHFGGNEKAGKPAAEETEKTGDRRAPKSGLPHGQRIKKPGPKTRSAQPAEQAGARSNSTESVPAAPGTPSDSSVTNEKARAPKAEQGQEADSDLPGEKKDGGSSRDK
jgi:protein phosphatase